MSSALEKTKVLISLKNNLQLYYLFYISIWRDYIMCPVAQCVSSPDYNSIYLPSVYRFDPDDSITRTQCSDLWICLSLKSSFAYSVPQMTDAN